MAADGTQIKQDINTDLGNKGYRGVRTWMIIATLIKVVDWVTGVINGNQGNWFKANTSTPAGTNSDDAARTGKVITGRTTDDGTGSQLQVEGYAYVKEGFFATNAQGYAPPVRGFGGQAIWQFLCNWALPGQTDLALLLTNPNSIGVGFWHLKADGGKTMSAFFRRNGNVGINTSDPQVPLDVAGAIRGFGFIAGGSAPTLATQGSLGTGGTVALTSGSTDMAGTLTITTGSNPGTTGFAKLTFSQALPATPKIVLLTPSDQRSALEYNKFVLFIDGPGSITLYGNGSAAPTASVSFRFNYLVIQ